MTVDLLRTAYLKLKRDAAPGVDGTTWREYGHDLEAKLVDLYGRVHRGAYRALPLSLFLNSYNVPKKYNFARSRALLGW